MSPCFAFLLLCPIFHRPTGGLQENALKPCPGPPVVVFSGSG